jgi:hypothetical protein
MKWILSLIIYIHISYNLSVYNGKKILELDTKQGNQDYSNNQYYHEG